MRAEVGRSEEWRWRGTMSGVCRWGGGGVEVGRRRCAGEEEEVCRWGGRGVASFRFRPSHPQPYAVRLGSGAVAIGKARCFPPPSQPDSRDVRLGVRLGGRLRHLQAQTLVG